MKKLLFILSAFIITTIQAMDTQDTKEKAVLLQADAQQKTVKQRVAELEEQRRTELKDIDLNLPITKEPVPVRPTNDINLTGCLDGIANAMCMLVVGLFLCGASAGG